MRLVTCRGSGVTVRTGEVSPPGGGGGCTHCEPDPKGGGSESRDRGAVTAPYP